MIKIKVNSKEMAFDDDVTISTLIKCLKIESSYIAIEGDMEIIPRKKWDECTISMANSYEVVEFVGGG